MLSVICEGIGVQTAHEQGLYLMEPTRSKRDIVMRFVILTVLLLLRFPRKENFMIKTDLYC